MSKLTDVGTTIFTVMSKLAAEHNAINLSQGFPDFPIDEQLKQFLSDISFSDEHQYRPMPGSPTLLNAITNQINTQYGRSILPDRELLVTAGATQGIFTAIMALVNAEDEVIILDPSYDCYNPAVRLAGGVPVHVDMTDDLMPDWQKISDSISDKTRLIITNNPHNPSGRVWGEIDMEELERIMMAYPKLLVLSDEVYEYITFEQKHLSVNERSSMRERAIVVSSFGKTYHITGWKIGYLVAPENLMSEIKKVHQFNVFSVNAPGQEALAKYVPVSEPDELGSMYKAKRNLFTSLLKESKFKLLPSEGTYFQVADYSDISDEKDVDFCKYLTKEVGVAAIPISVFNASGKDNKLIRFCFAKQEETLIEAAKKLCRI
jgi:methionine aminotransferase